MHLQPTATSITLLPSAPHNKAMTLHSPSILHKYKRLHHWQEKRIVGWGALPQKSAVLKLWPSH